MTAKQTFFKRLAAVVLALGMATGLLAACGAGGNTGAGNTESTAESLPSLQPDEPEGDADTGIPAIDEAIDEWHADRYAAMPLPEEMRAMWIAYPDFEDTNFASEAEFRVDFAIMMEECAAMGLNTVIVIVRPFADALYPSGIFPWSYLINGTQGYDPGYDPLAVMIEEAHQKGLRFEAYINPYRVKLNANKPGELCDENVAVINPDWAVEVGESMWLDPGLPEVRQLVVDGVVEILEKYYVDGIHFDDYFYPTFTAEQVADGLATEFDADTYAEYGGGMGLAEWRRDNVNTLVRDVYGAIKAYNPSVSFGISPAGNIDNNYSDLYAEVKTWMAEPGYIDYMMPQVYWEFGYTLGSGSTQFAFENITREWAALPRDTGVKLYAGLAAYKIHEGADDSWREGDMMARQVEYLRTVDGYEGFALFRYGSLLWGDNAAEREAEVANLAALLGGGQAAEAQSTNDEGTEDIGTTEEAPMG